MASPREVRHSAVNRIFTIPGVGQSLQPLTPREVSLVAAALGFSSQFEGFARPWPDGASAKKLLQAQRCEVRTRPTWQGGLSTWVGGTSPHRMWHPPGAKGDSAPQRCRALTWINDEGDIAHPIRLGLLHDAEAVTIVRRDVHEHCDEAVCVGPGVHM